ncbi:uncharacterized protein LOC133178879 [Saccostrea echinata]|uniref:uncharacterized protein LOC133178879 n=1 Tax=Saccostrea echinata TaxID=191078 RepID=UPI002A82C6D2|nr:uncharacterized protein LOC133178879 [Saccostrea echinata]
MDLENIKTWAISWITWPFSFVSRPIKDPIIGAFAGWASIWFLFHIGNTVLVYMAIFIIVFSVAEKNKVITIHWDRLRGLLSGRQDIKEATREKFPSWMQAIQEFLTNHMFFSIGYIVGLVVGIKF